MSSTALAIELPTNRQSKNYDGPVYDVHDPNYIPLLNDRAELRVDFSQPSFSALPSVPLPHESAAQTSLKRSKSASAPETVVHSHEEPPVPKVFSAYLKNYEPQEMGRGKSTNSPRQGRVVSPEENASSSGLSSTGSSAQLEEHVFMIPGNSTPKKEDLQCPTVPHSTRSSISSVYAKKPNVPTSRFNQKTPSLPNISSAASPRPPPKSFSRSTSESATTAWTQDQSPQRSIPIPPDPSPSVPHPSAPRLQVMKSTASERRARALHSHPLGQSSQTKSSQVLEEADEIPLMQQSSIPESHPPSVRSRSQSICNSRPVTPAPTTPLPDLPSALRKPAIQDRHAEKIPPTPPLTQSQSPSLTIPSPLPPLPAKDHHEMADFMKVKKLTVFRRFDDIHVRLLLHLQDEITALEKELYAIEKVGSHARDGAARKTSIMLELRRALAEYDHLFANWSSMQANQATKEMKEKLADWLQDPTGAAKSISAGAKIDVAWLHNSTDLSAVSTDLEKQSDVEVRPPRPEQDTPQHVAARGGIWAWLGCASTRK